MKSNERYLLEVAIASLEDALAARVGGADRLELNAGLALGGLTPSLGLLREVKAVVELPVVAMVRPRPSGFAYSDSDFQVMLADADLLLENGADGLAFGVLHEDGTVDVERCRRIVERIGERGSVFHRAFDVTPDPFAALEQLIEMGVRRVMTSGQQKSAYHGSATIRQLVEQAGDRIEILPAGGIDRFTLADVLDRTGCRQVHGSFRASRTDNSVSARPHVSFGGGVSLPENRYDATDSDSVALIREALDARK